MPEANVDKFKKLNSEIEELEQSNLNKSIGLWILGILLALMIAYIVFSEVKQPLFGKWPQIAEEHATLTSSNKMLSSSADSVLKVNDTFMENSLYNYGIFYEVQIGAFEHFDLTAYNQQLVNLRMQNVDGLNKYTLGKFRKFNDAEAFHKDVVKLGIQDAFIRASEDGKKITIKEARQKER